jgi:hypothetical protein
VSSAAFVPAPVLGHPVLEVRLGADSGAVGAGEPFRRPTICAEVAPLTRLSVEACGNGAGFLHQDDVSDMAHFRARYAAWMARRGRLDGSAGVGAGFAEVQRPGDLPGFQFGEAGAGAVEAAGAEVSMSARGRWWFDPHAFFSADLTVGGAYIPGAPEVLQQDGPVVPFGALTVGMGF